MNLHSSIRRHCESANRGPGSILVAVDANRRAIRVTVDATVIRVRLRLAAMRARMADYARKDRIVRSIDVAVRADRLMVWDLEPRVVKGRAQPICRGPSGMAG